MRMKFRREISAMFARYIENISRESAEGLNSLGPVTRRASGMIRLPKGITDRRLIEEAILEKHGPRK